MTVSTQIELAETIARRAHEGQLDRAGRPYIEHVERVAAGVTGADRAVAWLHDVVEDTDITAEDLIAAGIDPETVEAVEAITHPEDEPADDYYARVKANPSALRVKASDLADNSSPERIDKLEEPTRSRLIAKYAHAREVLGLDGDG